MAQRKNSVQLSATAIAKLQKLVDTGEYCSLDDAASHIIVSVLASTRQYPPVPTESTPKSVASKPVQDSTDQKPQTCGSKASPLDRLKEFSFD